MKSDTTFLEMRCRQCESLQNCQRMQTAIFTRLRSNPTTTTMTLHESVPASTSMPHAMRSRRVSLPRLLMSILHRRGACQSPKPMDIKPPAGAHPPCCWPEPDDQDCWSEPCCENGWVRSTFSRTNKPPDIRSWKSSWDRLINGTCTG